MVVLYINRSRQSGQLNTLFTSRQPEESGYSNESKRSINELYQGNKDIQCN